MSSVDALHKRIDHMIATIDRQDAPRLINCTGARDDLLAMLQRQPDEEGEDQEVVDMLDEPWVAEFNEFLACSVAEIEQAYNVKFVSYEN